MNRNRIGTAGLLLVGAVVMLAWAMPAFSMHASDVPELTIAEGQKVAVSVRASLGLLNGEARELVYTPLEGVGRYKVSELIWDLSGLVMGGGVVSTRVGERLMFNLGVWTALTEGDGGMVDYDWMEPGMDWTHRSISDVDVLAGQMFDLNASYRVFARNETAVRAIVGFKSDSWEWSDYGKDYVYSTYAFRDTEGSFNGQNVIDYEQTFNIPYVGVGLDYVSGQISFSAYLLYSPIVSADDKDHHLLREMHFEETFSGGDYLGFGLKSSYNLNERAFLTAALDIQAIPEIIGDLTIVELAETTPDAAGISHSSSMVSAGAGWKF